MEGSKLQILSNLMVERNLILNVLKSLSRELELKTIDKNLHDISYAKYLAKLDAIDIQLIKEAQRKKLSCSQCKQPLNGENHILSCMNCGYPFHEYHLKEEPISFENKCPICNAIYHVKRINDLITVELKTIENFYEKFHPKISLVNVTINGSPMQLPHNLKKVSRSKKDTMKSAKCPQCGEDVNPNWKFCKKCGHSIRKIQKDNAQICNNCGTPLGASWRFCKWCGAPTSE